MTGLARERLLGWPETPLPPDAAAALARAVERRASREPLAYVTGKREFYGRAFEVVPGVLVPRPETETLVDAAREAFPDPGAELRVLDIGVGTGCLLLTVLDLYPRAAGTGTDIADAALACAAANAAALGLAGRAELRRAVWTEGVAGPFDLVLGNPPYIPTAEIDALEPEVAVHEPRLALDGGPDGLDAYRAILADLPRLLAPGGVTLLEIGRGQEEALLPLAAAAGFDAATRPDLAGIARCLDLRRPGDRVATAS